jgi:hypothetical protein
MPTYDVQVYVSQQGPDRELLPEGDRDVVDKPRIEAMIADAQKALNSGTVPLLYLGIVVEEEMLGKAWYIPTVTFRIKPSTRMTREAFEPNLQTILPLFNKAVWRHGFGTTTLRIGEDRLVDATYDIRMITLVVFQLPPDVVAEIVDDVDLQAEKRE